MRASATEPGPRGGSGSARGVRVARGDDAADDGELVLVSRAVDQHETGEGAGAGPPVGAAPAAGGDVGGLVRGERRVQRAVTRRVQVGELADPGPGSPRRRRRAPASSRCCRSAGEFWLSCCGGIVQLASGWCRDAGGGRHWRSLVRAAGPRGPRCLRRHDGRRERRRGHDGSTGTSSAAVRTPAHCRTSPARSSRATGAASACSPQLAFGSIHMTSNSLPSGSCA